MKRERWLGPAVLAAALMVALMLVSCSPGSTSTPAHRTAEGQAGEAGGGSEGPSVSFVEPQQRYRIDSPGKMTAAADGTASFVGPEERLEVAIVQGSRASDPMALARADLASLKAGAKDFQQRQPPAATKVSGYAAVKLVYGWTAGTNQLTGKPIQLVTVRYYVARDATALAVISYGVSASQYDPQGADDVANTFKWL